MTGTEPLLQALFDDPDDTDAYAVYADHLQGRGDAHGELIALQLRLHESPADRKARSAETALLKREAERLTGGLLGRPVLRVEWQWGFIKTAHLRTEHYHELAPALRTLLSLPTAKLLRQLTTLCVEETERDYPSALLKTALQLQPPLLDAPLFGRSFDDLGAAGEAKPERVLRLDLDHLTFDQALPSLLRFKNLEELDLSFSTSRRVPPELAALPRLRLLDVAFCYALHEIASEVLSMPSLEEVTLYDCPLPDAFHMGRLNQLLAGFAKSGTPAAQRRVEVDLLLERKPKKNAEPPSTEALFQALDCNMAAVRQRAIAALELSSGAFPTASQAPAAIALLGSFNSDKKQLAARIAMTGATVLPRFGPKATHVLVGENGGAQALAARAAGVTLLFERPLLATLETLEGQPSAPEDSALSAAPDGAPAQEIADGLRSRERETTAAALKALEAAGSVPDALLLDLLLVMQDVKLAAPLRKRAKKLFALHAPPALQKAVAKHLKTSLLLDSLGETKRAERIVAVADDSQAFPALALAERLHAHAGVALGAIIELGDDAAIRAALASRVTADGSLDLSTQEFYELPGAVSAFPALRRIDLSGNHLPSFPEALLALEGLEGLDLTGNALTSLPDALDGLAKLRSLSLRYNQLRSFPPVLTRLSRLETLDLASEQYGYHDARIRGIPGDIDALEQLRELNYQFNIVERFPETFFTLPKLETLILRSAQLPEIIPQDLAKLPALSELVVAYSSWAERGDELRELLPKVDIDV